LGGVDAQNNSKNLYSLLSCFSDADAAQAAICDKMVNRSEQVMAATIFLLKKT